MHRSSSAFILAVLCAATTMAAASPDDAREQAIAAAKDALARETGIDARRISVSQVTAAEWRDGSLGCPQPGMSYTQALTRGYRVLLGVASMTYDFRVAGKQVVRCQGSAKEVDVEGSLAGLRLAKLARADLAGRMKAETSDVAIESIRPVRWPDPALPCAESKDAFTAVGSGHVIRLSSQGREFIYHADSERVVYCGPREADEEE